MRVSVEGRGGRAGGRKGVRRLSYAGHPCEPERLHDPGRAPLPPLLRIVHERHLCRPLVERRRARNGLQQRADLVCIEREGLLPRPCGTRGREPLAGCGWGARGTGLTVVVPRTVWPGARSLHEYHPLAIQATPAALRDRSPGGGDRLELQRPLAFVDSELRRRVHRGGPRCGEGLLPNPAAGVDEPHQPRAESRGHRTPTAPKGGRPHLIACECGEGGTIARPRTAAAALTRRGQVTQEPEA